MPRPHVVRLKQTPIDLSGELEVHATPEDCANSVASMQSVYIKTVIAEQGMEEIVGILATEGQLGSGGDGTFEAVPVVAEIPFEPHELGPVVGECGAKTLWHIWNVKSSW